MRPVPVLALASWAEGEWWRWRCQGWSVQPSLSDSSGGRGPYYACPPIQRLPRAIIPDTSIRRQTWFPQYFPASASDSSRDPRDALPCTSSSLAYSTRGPRNTPRIQSVFVAVAWALLRSCQPALSLVQTVAAAFRHTTAAACPTTHRPSPSTRCCESRSLH